MIKYFVVADAHGFFTELQLALKEQGFDKDNPHHVFVSLGDLLDRGSQPAECLQFVNDLPKDRKILIRGNHEDLIEDLMERGFPLSHDIHNGTAATLLKLAGERSDIFSAYAADYMNVIEKVQGYPPLNEYLKSTVDYAEIGDCILVHGWIPMIEYSPDKDWRKGDWKSARWYNGMEMWSKGYRIPDHTIICGHWHTSYGHEKLHGKILERVDPERFVPFVDDGIVAMDATTVLSGKINCIVIEVEKEDVG